MTWLRRSNDNRHAAPLLPEDALPASVRNPEKHRFGGDSDTDEVSSNDEDLQFLAALAREATDVAERAAEPETGTAATRTVVAASDDALDMFRESRQTLKAQHGYAHRVEPVDIADLLEDLATTAAALRRRKAA